MRNAGQGAVKVFERRDHGGAEFMQAAFERLPASNQATGATGTDEDRRPPATKSATFEDSLRAGLRQTSLIQ